MHSANKPVLILAILQMNAPWINLLCSGPLRTDGETFTVRRAPGLDHSRESPALVAQRHREATSTMPETPHRPQRPTYRSGKSSYLASPMRKDFPPDSAM